MPFLAVFGLFRAFVPCGRFSGPFALFCFLWPSFGALCLLGFAAFAFIFLLSTFPPSLIVVFVLVIVSYIMHNQRRTVNIHTGRKLSGKSCQEILEAVLSRFNDYGIHADQQFFDLIRITFDCEEAAVSVLKDKGVRLFDMWCRMDGGPPTTIIHLFDYPYEEDEESVGAFFDTYGTVKSVRCQKYVSHPDVCTGTRLVDLVMKQMPPRMVNIKGYMCRVWFKGQPLVCNLCGGKGHRAADCPNKDKCRLCGSRGHFARNCTNPWNNQGPRVADATVENTAVDVTSNTASADDPSPGTSSQQSADAGGAESGDVVVDGVDEPGSADVVAGTVKEPLPPATETSVADGVLNDLFASSDSDSSSEGDPDITEFPSEDTNPPSQIISQFSEESQSILRNVSTKINDQNALTKDIASDNGISSNNLGLPASSDSSNGNAKTTFANERSVTSVSKNAPDPDVSAKIPVVTIVDGDDSVELIDDDDGLMDTSGGSRKRKSSPGDSDSDSPGSSHPESLHTEGLCSKKRAAGDSSG